MAWQGTGVSTLAKVRELLEETSWSLASFSPIGVLHFTHVDPVPEGSPYPYPDFIQVVYAGSLGSYDPELKEADDYVLGSEFVPVGEARRLPLDAGQVGFLDAAIRASERDVV